MLRVAVVRIVYCQGVPKKFDVPFEHTGPGALDEAKKFVKSQVEVPASVENRVEYLIKEVEQQSHENDDPNSGENFDMISRLRA